MRDSEEIKGHINQALVTAFEKCVGKLSEANSDDPLLQASIDTAKQIVGAANNFNENTIETIRGSILAEHQGIFLQLECDTHNVVREALDSFSDHIPTAHIG